MLRVFRAWPAGFDATSVTIEVEEGECPGCALASRQSDVSSVKPPAVYGFCETPDGNIVYRVITLHPGGWTCMAAEEEDLARALKGTRLNTTARFSA